MLLLPTQRLLNVHGPFPSVLNPGNTVELPKFIKANLALTVDAIRGLGSYPVLEPSEPDRGATLQTLPTDSRSRPICRLSTKGSRRSSSSSIRRRRRTRRARRRPWPMPTAFANTCPTPIAPLSTSRRRGHSLRRPTTAITARSSVLRKEPGFQTVARRDHLGPRDRVLLAATAARSANRVAPQVHR